MIASPVPRKPGIVWQEQTFHAKLPLPPSINRTGDVKTSNVQRKDGSVVRVRHTDPRARNWKDAALFELRRQGWRPVPDGRYHIEVRYILYCAIRRDIDSSTKLILDVIKVALNVDDHCVNRLIGQKIPTKRRAEHSLNLSVDVSSSMVK